MIAQCTVYDIFSMRREKRVLMFQPITALVTSSITIDKSNIRLFRFRTRRPVANSLNLKLKDTKQTDGSR